jgi:hypothetical protein
MVAFSKVRLNSASVKKKNIWRKAKNSLFSKLLCFRKCHDLKTLVGCVFLTYGLFYFLSFICSKGQQMTLGPMQYGVTWRNLLQHQLS